MNPKRYSLVDPMLFLKQEEYEKKVKSLQENENEFPFIFFKINEGKFQNWFIQLTNIGLREEEEDLLSIQCQYSIVKVPKSITDDMLDTQKPELDQLVSSVFNEIIAETNNIVSS